MFSHDIQNINYGIWTHKSHAVAMINPPIYVAIIRL
jgi:hypothetical protein